MTFAQQALCDNGRVSLKTLLPALVLALAGLAQAAPARVSFWHYVGTDAPTKALRDLAAEFNKSQDRSEVVIQQIGDYQSMTVRLVASLRSGGQGAPTMAMVDNAFFTRMALGGQLAPLDELVKDLPKATVDDFYPVLWQYGIAGGKRYGLPWAASTLLLYYNADALRARGLKPPTTWDEFARTARALTGRGTKGAVFVTDAWIFTSVIASRGGSLLTEDEKPDFAGEGAVGTLRFLQDMVKAGTLIPRSLDEVNLAVLDFLRTKAFMVVAPSSAFPIARQNSIGFRPGAVALPGRTLAGEAQLVVLKGADAAQQKGAVEFWQFLTRPENIARWVRASSYLPARRGAAKLLEEHIAGAPEIAAGMAALERAYNLPRLLEFQDWRTHLEDALERSLKGGVDPLKALQEAQRLSVAPK